MKKEIINTTYLDSRWYLDYKYEDYVRDCEDLGITPCEENSNGYWDYISEETNINCEDFFDNLEYSPINNTPCMVVGSVGRWNGNFEIVPVLFDNISDAIHKCLNGADDYEIVLKDGYITVYGYHHDGCNSFEIHILSKKGMKEIDRPKYEYDENYNVKPWWFKKIYGYLF